MLLLLFDKCRTSSTTKAEETNCAHPVMKRRNWDLRQDSGAEGWHATKGRDIAIYKKPNIKLEPSRRDVSVLLLPQLNREVIIVVSCLPHRPVSKISKVV